MSQDFPTVGVLGDSESTRFFIPAALDLGIDLQIFESDINLDNILNFSAQCNVLSIFDDSVPTAFIRTLEGRGCTMKPGSLNLERVREYSDRLQGDALKVNFYAKKYSIAVARSPHGQAAVWAPAEIDYENGVASYAIAPPSDMEYGLIIEMQNLALNLSKDLVAIGVVSVEMEVHKEQLSVTAIHTGPRPTGNWTLEGSRTSQYEQHLRAILDLPLGDPTMTARYCVTGDIISMKNEDESRNQYRPYLHLMARSPGLKVHQYGKFGKVTSGHVTSGHVTSGHVTALGEDLLDLRENVRHALEYMSGVIDE